VTIRVIGRKYLPSPSVGQVLWHGMLLHLTLTHFNAVPWVLGVVWTLWGLLSAVVVYALFASEHVHPKDL
jgi:hypothetical protein